MKKKLLVAAATMVIVLVALALPAQATSVTVVVADNSYSPKNRLVGSLGETVQWDNQGSNVHTATQNGPWKLWNTGDIEPASMESIDANWAGTFPYHCQYHPMKGSIKVPLDVIIDQVTMGTADAPTGMKYQLQMRKGSHDFKQIYKGKARQFFLPELDPGEYDLRSRVLHVKSGEGTGWSPLYHFLVAG